MSRGPARRYDVAIVGAGPVGSVCAIVHARKGARVALFEANPEASKRLAGEWLHPPAVRILRDIGIQFDTPDCATPGKGFAVFPEDGTQPIMLPYLQGSHGLACEHAELVSRLHDAVHHEPNIDFFVPARVRSLEDQQVNYVVNGAEKSLSATRIVGADGRASVVRKSLGLQKTREACSRMVGVIVEGADLQLKGYGHVLLGGPGPILMYQLGDHRVRVIADVPLDHWIPRDRVNLLSDSYAGCLPEAMQSGFVEALRAGAFHVAANEIKPRLTYGNEHRVLVGDAAGHYHPMTAVGMTMGFGDALDLAECEDFHDFARKRFQEIRAPQLLAMGLYEVFADHRAESIALRQATYHSWRAHSNVHERTIDLLACEDTSVPRLSFAFSLIVMRALVQQIPRSLDRLAWRRVMDIVSALFVRLGWLVRGAQELWKARKSGGDPDNRAQEALAGAFLASIPPKGDGLSPPRQKEAESVDAGPALTKASRKLLDLQGEDGGWEGEMAWCPMLTAQYVLAHHIMERPLEPERRRHLLHYFKRTRLDEGAWGMHEHSPPHLFVTTLVYVALRVLGIRRDDPLIGPARQFLQSEGVLNVPSWGKFWLALLNLYDWRGVNAVLPELYSMPRWVALHPSNWYCHTRLIYMAMAAIYPSRFQVPVTPLIASLREELFPQGYATLNFSRSRNRLRSADLFARPSVWLRAGYGLARLYERFHGKQLRARSVDTLLRHIRWEMQTTSHTCISPVSGLLSMLALWLRDPDDLDLSRALEQLDGWVWEDEDWGARVTGARSASWDTGFCLQALATLAEHGEVRDALHRGADFLLEQQVGTSFEGFREAYRSDPKGGWCFAGGWHGWPVSDCTAEAVSGLIAVQGEAASAAVLGDAIQFMLRRQNRDGGFGSYEAQRSRVGLEWLNPAEMFGESMTEHSYIECTASCLAAFAACQRHFPQMMTREVTSAISRAEAWIRRTQGSDGSWRGVWGVQFIYGTLFGVRGLLASGAQPSDPALRLACRWLLERQRSDGGWGEHHSGCLPGRYVAHEESQVIQSAWALMALLEAGDSSWNKISMGARYLLDTQATDGTWPKQDMAGVFFRTALLDYVLYRQYFPLHALGLYEQRRLARQELVNPVIRNIKPRQAARGDHSEPTGPLRSSA